MVRIKNSVIRIILQTHPKLIFRILSKSLNV